MIRDFFFFVKMLILTAFVVMFAQVKIGNATMETRFDAWVKNSVLVDYLQEAIDGGLALLKVSYSKADSNMHFLLARISRKHTKKDSSLFHFSLKRHNTDKTDGEPSSESIRAKTQSPNPE
jgi:hypothetical protein